MTGRRPERTALVTGAGRRIGAVIARRLAEAGYRVTVTSRSPRRGASSLAREIGGTAVRLDLAHPKEFGPLAAALARSHRRLDLLVHNAAVFPRTPFERVTPRDWDRVFDVNLRGPFLLTRALLPLLRRTPGAGVVFLGDAGARRLWPAYLPYCLSKLALEGQAAALRKVLAPDVRVGIVRPGLALAPEGFPGDRWKALRRSAGTRRLDSPGKVAEAVLRFARTGW